MAIKTKKKKEKEQTFRVYAKVVTYCYLDVTAKSQDKAEEIAQDTDGGDFITEEIEDGGEFIVCPENKPTHTV